MRVFDRDEDRVSFLRKLSMKMNKHGVRVSAWCLMPNHIHLVAIPVNEDGLSRAVGRALWAYSRYYNEIHGVNGRLFQGRFFSTPMDDEHTYAAIRYILRNPVKAQMAVNAWDYRWSSARYSMGLEANDSLLTPQDIPDIDDWRAYLSEDADETEVLRQNTMSGRPSGSEEFVARIESRLGREVRKKKRGRHAE